jgi:hypothetical protein
MRMYNTEYIANNVAIAIFSGTLIITLFLIVINFFKIKLTKIDKLTLIKAINTILLFGAMIYTVIWVTELFVAYYSGGEYGQYTFANRLFGSYWWAALALLVRSVLLPQILWIKKLRRSFIATIIIISVWAVINIPVMLIDIRGAGFNLWGNFYWWLINWGQLLVYIVLLTAVYFILKRKELANSKSRFAGG